MDKNLTELVIVSDRSGSMESIRGDAQGGINSFISDQANQPGECRLTFVEFDDKYEIVHDGEDIKNVKEYELVPRGMTALWDAVGKAISTVGDRLSKTDEDKRPGLVVVVISTDGQENSSREYSRDQLRKMIKLQTDVYKWKFHFLGAGIDAQESAKDLEIATSGGLSFAREKTGEAYRVASSKVLAMRGATARGASEPEMLSAASYTDEERKQVE